MIFFPPTELNSSYNNCRQLYNCVTIIIRVYVKGIVQIRHGSNSVSNESLLSGLHFDSF